MISCLMPCAATEVELFPFAKDVVRPDAKIKKVALFHLDEELLSASDDGYTNVRLFDADGKEHPLLIRTARTKKAVVVERKVAAEAKGFQKLRNNSIEMIYKLKKVDSGKAPSPSRLLFKSMLRDYEKQVSVWGSKDQQSWDLLAENQPIFDYSRFIDMRNSSVSIKSGTYTHYKILISNITEKQQSPLVSFARETRNGALASEVEKISFRRKDFRIDALEFFETQKSIVRSKVLAREYPVKGWNVEDDADEKTTVLTFETGRAPITALTLTVDSANFSRQVKVERSNDRNVGDKEWRYVASAGISKIDVGTFKQDVTKITLGRAVRCEKMRVTISNRDSPALEISGVKADGEMHEALFFTEEAGKFTVMYGAAGMSAPAYDIAEVLAKVEGADASLFTLAAQKDNSRYDEGRRPQFKARSLLVLAVVLMVIGLGWIILKTVKNLDV
jgi:hypothetical protein